jgi:hypothetical protein
MMETEPEFRGRTKKNGSVVFAKEAIYCYGLISNLKGF